MNTTTNDSQLLAACQKAMVQGNYDEAIEYTNQMINRTVAIKAHLLVIEHEAATAKVKNLHPNLSLTPFVHCV